MSAQQLLARRLLSLTDLTSLNDSDDDSSVRNLAALACTRAGKVAALCIWPRFITVAAHALRDSGVAIAAVANFPAGAADSQAAAAQTAAAVSDGADEVDVVFPYRALLAGDALAGLSLVRACRAMCGARTILKVILETGQLGEAARIRRAADIAIDGGAHFLKTSTGKSQPAATPEAAAVMLDAIAAAAARGVAVGFKVSGGIRTIDDALPYLTMYERRFGEGAASAASFRIGTSTLVTALLAILEPAKAP
jgi:deoxyribose-phosphate aldolase